MDSQGTPEGLPIDADQSPAGYTPEGWYTSETRNGTPPFLCYLFKVHNSAEVGMGEKESKMEMVKIKSELLRDNIKLHRVPTGLPGQATTHCRIRNLQQPHAIPQQCQQTGLGVFPVSLMLYRHYHI